MEALMLSRLVLGSVALPAAAFLATLLAQTSLRAQTSVGEIVGSQFGSRLGAAMDMGWKKLSGNGTCDYYRYLTLGAPEYLAKRGRVELWREFTPGSRFWILTGHMMGNMPGDEYGFSLSAGLDLDVEAPDTVIGAPGANQGTGYAEVISSGDCASESYREPRTVSWTFSGNQIGERFGHAVLLIPDVDGDGKADVLVSAPRRTVLVGSLFRHEAGAVHVYSGHQGTLLRIHDGDSTNGHFGWSLASVGDLDDDGVDDYAIGEPGHDITRTRTALPEAGRVRVYSGATGTLISALTSTGSKSTAQHGWSLANAGDINGDGRPDLAVGSPGYDLGSPSFPLFDVGRFEIRSGADGSVLMHKNGSSFLARMGTTIRGGADANDDGVPDLLVGAPGFGGGRGRVQLWSLRDDRLLYDVSGEQTSEGLGTALYLEEEFFAAGRPGFSANHGGARVWSTKVDWSLRGERPFWGGSVAILHDVNGDGWDDFAIAQYTETASLIGPRWEVRCGRTSNTLHEEGTLTTHRGFTIASLGDQNGDGLREVAIAMPQTGSLEIRSGANLSQTLLSYSGQPGQQFVRDVEPVGDLDGDGTLDYAIIAPRWNSALAMECGRIDIMSGTGTFLRSHHGDEAYERLGTSFASFGDMDGDGVADYGAGAPYASAGIHPELGQVILWSGATGTEIATLLGDTTFPQSGRFGHALCGPGDLDGDGLADIVIGEPNFAMAANPMGRVRVLAGGPQPSTANLLYDLLGPSPGSRFGAELAAVGDADLDGTGDFATVAPMHAQGPKVSILSGSSGSPISAISHALSYVPTHVSLAGRASGHTDLRQELITGFPRNSSAESLTLVHMLPTPRTSGLGGACSLASPPPSAIASAPYYGKLLHLSFSNLPLEPGINLMNLYLGPPQAPVFLGDGCSLFVDPSTAIEIPFIYTTTQTSTSIVLDLPIANHAFYFQGVILQPAAPQGVALTDCLRLRVGFAFP